MTHSLQVLIVDDEKHVGDSLQEHLLAKGISVKAVTQVQDAIRIVKKDQPALAFVDIFLPELDGFDLAEEIFIHCPSCKIILMSGIYDFNESHLKHLGFEDFIKKPLNFQEVDMLVEKYKLRNTR